MNTLSAADKRKARIAVLKRVLRTLAGIEHNRADMIELEQIIRELGGSTRDMPHKAARDNVGERHDSKSKESDDHN